VFCPPLISLGHARAARKEGALVLTSMRVLL
jgi:hypothetical protein